MRGPRAGDQGLGRHAAGVDAGAAEPLAFDQRDRAARLRQPPGQRRTGLPGTDDDRVEAAGVVPAATVTIGSAAGTPTGPASACKPATAPTRNANRLLAMSPFLPRIRHSTHGPPQCPSPLRQA